MDSEVAPQTDALSVIHEIESTAQSSDHPEFCALKFRQTLNKSVINMFTDLNKVAEESQNASMLSTFSKFIRCFRHCLEEFPQIFVSCTAVPANPGEIGISHDALTSNADKEQNNVALAFTEWLIMRLIRVLSQPSVSVIHSGCQDLFISLLRVVRARDPANFCRLANCLLTLLSDLNSFNEKCYEKENGNHSFIIQNYFSSNRSATKKEGENLDLADIPIVIKSADECEYLQVKLTIFLGQLIADLSQFLPDQYNNLWEMLCVQIELGELELKKESLNVIASMVRIKGLPTSEMHVNYILDCLQVLIAFFCSGQIYDSNESEMLELSLALALTAVMRTIKETEITFVLDNFTLSRTLEDILQAIINHGLYKIRSQELQSAILKAILSLMSYLKECGYLLSKEIMTRAQMALYAHFGKLKSHKHLVPLLVFLIKQEIDKKFALKSENALNIHPVKLGYAIYPVEMPVASVDCEPKSKKQKKLPNDSSLNDMIPVYQKMKKNSEIWSSVHEILQNLVKNQDLLYQCDKTLKITNAISACVEILLCSSLTNANSQILQDHVADFSKVNCIKHACLPPDLLHSLKCYALKLSTCKEVGKKEVLEEIIILSNSLIHSQDLLFWTTEVHDGLCLILSIPWLGDAKDDLHDLKCDELSRQSVSHWRNVISSQIKILCLQGLTFLPSTISPYWRTRIIKLGLINEDAEVRSAALQVLPIYFYSMGSVNHILLHELTEPVSQDNNCTVLRTLAGIIGKLSCVIDSSCSFYRENDCDGLANLKPKLVCNICDKGNAQKEKSAELRKLTWLQDIFMHTLCHSNAEVRKESVSNIRSYFAHNEMDEKVLNSVLCLITDSDYSIRFSFSNVVSSILKPPGKILTDGWNSEMDENLITKLKSSLLIAQSSGNVRLQETILLTIGQIGKVAKDGLLLIVIISLLESLLSNIPSVLVVARSQLKEIAHSRKLRMADLFKTYREPICKFLARAMLDCCAQDVNRSSNVLEEIRNIFQFNDIRSFLSRILRYILPYLVSKTTPYTSTLLKNLAKQLNIHRRDLLMDNFSFIFSHLVRHCKKSELEKSLTYVQKETELEFGSLLRCNYQHIHNELLLHISTHYEQVFSGLATLAMKNNDLKGKESLLIIKPQEMADYLQPKLLGFLVFFDSQLLNNSVTVDNKKLALESLISIMGLMGQRHITAVRFKIMATLRIALRFKEGNFPKISCRAWNTFVHSVDMSSLGPLLNQVVVALLPLLELEPLGVAEIFNFLIVENQSNLKDYFHDLYFIPDIPELQVIHAVLKEYTDKPSSQADFHSVLSHSLKGISHENLEVRLHALAKVKQVLHTHQGAVHEHLLSRESADHLISHLISIILSVCRDTDMRSRILLGECLGELGAIDPGRLELKSTNSTETLAHFYNSIDNENFAYDLIQELVRSFLAAADCRIQDCSAFAIQEVLRIYKCSDKDSSSSSGCQLWKRFPPDIQEILAVLLHSQYKPQGKNKEGFPRPIYRSRMGSTFKDWVTNWFSDLLQKVKQEMATKVFHSCSMIIKHDLNCALFLLPHVVVYALMGGSESEKEQISGEIIAVLTHSEQSQLSSQSDLCYLSSQTVFSVFDHLAKWIRHQQQILNAELKQSGQRLSEDQAYTSVKHFISQIPQYLLAKSSYGCQAYARALMHLEQHIKNQPSEFQNCISFLQKLYASLDEPDGVAGVAAIRKEDPSLEDQILEHEATGHMQDAFACYEKAVKVYRGEISYYSGLLKCFLWMDQPITALTYANGLLNDRPEWEEQLNSYRIEAAWKLSSWSDLESFLNHVSVTDKWNVSVGKILFAANKEDSSEFLNQMKSVRSSQMGPLSAASMEIGAYLRGYEYLSRLHMLTDLNKSVEVFFNLNTNEQNLPESTLTIDGILSEWKTRQQLVQSSQRYQEPVLDLHRVLLKMGKAKHPELSEKFDHEIAHCWLQSAKLARKNGHQQRAYSCLLEAGTVNSPIAFMEKTKWHWNKGEKEQAINTLNKGIQEHFPDISKLKVNSPNFSNQDQLMCAKAKLLLARYSEESAIVDSNSLIQMYRDVVSIQPHWEESHFHLAKYFDKMLNTVDKPESRAEVTVRIAKSFGNSLQYGCKHVYHSLPRLLDLWFDMGTQVVEHSMAKKVPASLKQIEMYLNQLSNVIIPGMLEKLPLFHFLTAFPQIISRICHSHSDISEQLQKIIAKLLATYSQQAMWMMIAVSKSSYPTRVQRCKKIFHQAISMKPELGKFIQDTTRLADKLIELSNKSVPDSNVLSISQHFQSLPKLIEDRKFSPVLLPFQAQMMVTLPSGTGLSSDHNPFPQTFVYIQGLQDTVEIFPSLQRPKKLTIRGSDGKLYALICKPKDDLRKDCRLIEFNNLVNRYLKRDPESRRRQLYIRTYAVVPLNEECGLIEWVPNLSGLRQILNKIYKDKGIYVSGREIKHMMPPRGATAEQKLQIFKNKFLPRFPPVFSEWFLKRFPDPTAWYIARLAYARTTAVMSMVGYIVGLGDRHGENILFDSSCGDTVHVDLNCLFNKGETLDCPECVPFRLTHNMIDVMGPTGYEGVFRKACEVTMRVMRSQTDALMSVLRPFIHDPLVEWSKSSKAARAQSPASGEIRNEMGLTHVKDIEHRLNGIIKSKNKHQGLPLSIEGQVNYLIQEATDENNLSQMYIGWTAYM